jgi:hypothetical protein
MPEGGQHKLCRMLFWPTTCFPLLGSCMKRIFSYPPGPRLRVVPGVSLACLLLLRNVVLDGPKSSRLLEDRMEAGYSGGIPHEQSFSVTHNIYSGTTAWPRAMEHG